MKQERAKTSLNKSVDHSPFSRLSLQKPAEKSVYGSSERSRPDTPPFNGDGKKETPTHVKISDLTSSINAEKAQANLNFQSPFNKSQPPNPFKIKPVEAAPAGKPTGNLTA